MNTRIAFVLAVSGVIFSGAACSDQSRSIAGSEFPDVRAGKSVSDVVVSSTTPDSATQDTTLDVTINGSGFVSGAVATWAYQGISDAAQVRTNRTTYVSSRKLIANITISATATVGNWDVHVMAGSKGGIGTEAFAVKAGGKPIPDATPDFFLTNDVGYLLRGDGIGTYLEGSASPYAGMSRYRAGECGVGTTLFNSPSTAGGDAILNTAATMEHKCQSYPRGVRITYSLINAGGTLSNEGSASVKSFFNLAQVQGGLRDGIPAIYIPVGSTEARGMNLQDAGKCITLRFRPVLRDGTVTGADEVRVTRTSADTWIVRTADDEVDGSTGQVIHHDKAWCESSGKLYHLPTMFVIHNSTPLSP
jgi:hypothetical protein